MQKRVRLAHDALQWLRTKEDIVSTDWVVSIVLWTPVAERHYYTENGRPRFYIPVKRKVGNQRKTIVMRVEETESEYVVLKLHLEGEW